MRTRNTSPRNYVEAFIAHEKGNELNCGRRCYRYLWFPPVQHLQLSFILDECVDLGVTSQGCYRMLHGSVLRLTRESHHHQQAHCFLLNNFHVFEPNGPTWFADLEREKGRSIQATNEQRKANTVGTEGGRESWKDNDHSKLKEETHGSWRAVRMRTHTLTLCFLYYYATLFGPLHSVQEDFFLLRESRQNTNMSRVKFSLQCGIINLAGYFP
eukprot:XP_017456617.1 PREDICTED: uncharacterized protein LOC102548128 [Rattus norvegicus]